jgi:hypothetical protein
VVIVGEQAVNHAQQSYEEMAKQEEIEQEVRWKLAGKQREIQELFDADVKEIFANVTVVIAINGLGGAPKVESVSLTVASTKGSEGSSGPDDGIIFMKETHNFSFRLFDVATEKERLRIEAEQSDLADELNEVAKDRKKVAADSQQGKGPLKPKETKPEPPKASAAPTELLKPPGYTAPQQQFAPFPGMSASNPIRDAKQWTDNARKYGDDLIKKGESLLNNGASEPERKQWQLAVSQWFSSLRYMKNWFTQQSRSEAVNACVEMLDLQGSKLRNLFGAM